MDTNKQADDQNKAADESSQSNADKQVIHPFGSDKEISLEEVEKEQQYKEALTERD